MKRSLLLTLITVVVSIVYFGALLTFTTLSMEVTLKEPVNAGASEPSAALAPWAGPLLTGFIALYVLTIWGLYRWFTRNSPHKETRVDWSFKNDLIMSTSITAVVLLIITALFLISPPNVSAVDHVQIGAWPSNPTTIFAATTFFVLIVYIIGIALGYRRSQKRLKGLKKEEVFQ